MTDPISMPGLPVQWTASRQPNRERPKPPRERSSDEEQPADEQPDTDRAAAAPRDDSDGTVGTQLDIEA